MAQHPSPSLEENEEETKGKDLQKALEQDISQQDATQVNLLAQFGGAFALFKTKNFVTIRDTFDTLKDPKLKDKLLDFENPQECQIARHSIRLADRQLRKKGVAKEQTETRFLFWHTKITHEEFTRATYATAIARKVHNEVNTRSVEIKIQNHLSRFGLGSEETPKLRSAINKWLKENPGRTIDDALIVETRRIYREQGKKLSKKEERELRGEYQKCRQKAIEELKDTVVKNGEEAIQYLSDSQRSTTSLEELHRANQHLKTGQEIQVPPPPSQVIPAPTPQPQPTPLPISSKTTLRRPFSLKQKITNAILAATTALTLQGGVLPKEGEESPKPPTPITWEHPGAEKPPVVFVPKMPISPAPTVIPTQPKILSFVPSGIRDGLSVFSSKFNSLFEGLKGKLGSFLGGLTGGLTSVLGKGKSIAERGINLLIAGGKQLLNRGIDAIAPGAGVAIGKINDIVKGLTGIDVEGFILKAAIFAVAVPVGLFLLVLFGLTSKLNVLPYYGAENALRLKASIPSSGNLYTWERFEKESLTIERPGLSGYNWRQFEKENLIPEKSRAINPKF